MTVIPQHKIASWLENAINDCLQWFGISHSETAEAIIYFIIVLGIALGVGWLLQTVVVGALRRIVRRKNSEWGNELLRERTLSKCARVIPPLVLLGFLPFAFDNDAAWHTWATRIVAVWFVICFGYGVCAVLRFIWIRYDTAANTRRLPMRGIYDLGLGLTWLIVAIISVSILIDKSPAMLLTGLGAVAAAMMFVFKDTILGFVAGIQLSNNDMVRVGDWITVPNTPADGVVEDVNISVVKVRNFDNTMVYLPPYSLVDNAFKNWRGMSEFGIRLISRNILIDASTIKADEKDPSTTNLTLFRKWCLDYLNNNPHLDHSGQGNSLIMVRLMAQEASGVPMQLYCFTNTTVWPDYEAIQSEVMEHVIAAANQFGLTVYNYPTKL